MGNAQICIFERLSLQATTSHATDGDLSAACYEKKAQNDLQWECAPKGRTRVALVYTSRATPRGERAALTCVRSCCRGVADVEPTCCVAMDDCWSGSTGCQVHDVRGPLFAVGDRRWDRISPRIFIRTCVSAADLHWWSRWFYALGEIETNRYALLHTGFVRVCVCVVEPQFKFTSLIPVALFWCGIFCKPANRETVRKGKISTFLLHLR